MTKKEINEKWGKVTYNYFERKRSKIREATQWLYETGDYSPFNVKACVVNPEDGSITPAVIYNDIYGSKNYAMHTPYERGKIDVGSESDMITDPVLIGGLYNVTGVYLPINASDKAIDWAADFIKNSRGE